MEHSIRIDLRKSVSANAEQYYEDAKRARQKLVGAKKALEDTEKKLEDLKRKRVVSAAVEEPQAKKAEEKRWFDKFHSFTSSDGFFVVGGKDATTNEILIKKHTDDPDLVFHADVHGAPFFVIKNPEKKEVPLSTIKETAEAAASFSSAWKSGMGSCDVYYVKPGQVSKTAPSGEYMPKGGFMIGGKKEYMRGMRLMVVIGFIVADKVEIIAGPLSAVESKTKYYAAVTPGDVKSGELAKSVKEAAAKKAGKEDADMIRKIKPDLIQRLIPGGKGQILR
jgi:predicted ribosome quality control (RQC) complex YloA/Tae2 family protein